MNTDATPAPQSASASASENAVLATAKGVIHQMDDFIRARPVITMTMALLTGVGFAVLTRSTGETCRSTPHGRRS